MTVRSIIRQEADRAGAPANVALAIAIAESGLDPAAANTAGEDSHGLFQLNRAGGQGVGHTVAELRDPRQNARIALGPIAAAAARCGGEIICTAINSGHPGRVPRTDPRVQRIAAIYRNLEAGGDGFVGAQLGTAAAAGGLNPAAVAVGAGVALLVLL